MRFHLVDRILEVEHGQRIRATRRVSGAEPALHQHPELGCVLSPVLAVESLAQTSAWLILETTEFAQRGVLGGLRGIEFGRLARPGDCLELTSEVESWSDEAVVFRVEARSADESVVRIESALCFLVPAEQMEDPADTRHHCQMLHTGSEEGTKPTHPGADTYSPTAARGWIPYDTLTEVIPGETATAVKSVAADDPVFATHFPRFPVVPGVLLMESMVGLARTLLDATEGAGSWWELKAIQAARFQKYVRPGNQLVIRAKVLRSDQDEVALTASGEVGGATVIGARQMVLSRCHH